MSGLQAYVHVDGRVYGPGDDVPAEHARLITNPKAWEAGAAPSLEASAPAEPPRSGKGSGRGEWAAYAASLGVDVQDADSREDIIAAVDAQV